MIGQADLSRAVLLVPSSSSRAPPPPPAVSGTEFQATVWFLIGKGQGGGDSSLNARVSWESLGTGAGMQLLG